MHLNFALKSVLLQNRHHIAYESQKLNTIEKQYIVFEKEMLVMGDCLRAQRQYLWGSPSVVKTDNNATCHFFSQPKLTLKHIRQQEFLAELDFEFEHKKGISNQVVDALSRKSKHAAPCMLAHLQTSKVDGSMCYVLKEFLKKDPSTQTVTNLAKASKTRKLQVEEGLLVTRRNQLYSLGWEI